jgi:hypothetical protein
MANYTKHEQSRAEIAAMIEAALSPRPEPPRRCPCGAHREEADAAFGR